MKIESIDPTTLAVQVSCPSEKGWELPIKLSSLIMVALDCRIPSIRCEIPDRIEPSLRTSVEQLAARNAIVRLVRPNSRVGSAPDLGFHLLGRDNDFICVRDAERENRYSLLVAGVEGNVDRASRCAYIIAATLGFSSSFSFEIRFSVYELLSNVIEHGLGPETGDWVQVDLERNGDKLLIAIIDRGSAFDPTGDEAFDLKAYISAKKRRGLGLIMTRRIAEQITYTRESGLNKVIFKKSISSRDAAQRTGKEASMAQFEVGGPTPLGDGSHVLLLSGDLDTKGALIMEQMLSQLMEKKIFQTVFDFEKVPFISSAGVGILLGIVSSLREAGGEATFIKISPKVRSVFRLLNLEDYFTIRDSVGSAV
jgi:anti-anti-sigma factor